MDSFPHPGSRPGVHWMAPAALAAAAALTACGSSGTSSTSTSSAPATSAPATSAPATSASTATAAPTVPATVSTTTGPLGPYLTGGNGRTLYLFGRDTGTTSTCAGTCAVNWPPLLTKGAPKTAGQAQPAKLGTTARSGGTTQVTYAGHPLYLFIGDTGPGQTKGQGVNAFGGLWYIVSPAGSAIQGAPAPSSASASASSGGGY